MKRILLILLAVFLLSVAFFFAFILPGLRSATTATWNSSSGDTVSDRFLYAMFPAGDGSEFAQYMPPRVVLNSHLEVFDDSETYRIFDAQGAEHFIPKSALSFEPTSESLGSHLDSLNETIAAWGSETDFQSVSLEFQSTRVGLLVTLTVNDVQGAERQYTYLVQSGIPIPSSTTIHR